MKIAFLGDTHFGCRNSNQVIQRHQELFLDKVFWPYIKEHNIETVIQTGDYFDNRKWINLQTMSFQKRVFVDRAAELGVTVHGIIGNHDIPLRHSLQMNSPQQILTESHMKYYSEAKVINFDGIDITFIPWVCKENYNEITEVINKGGDLLVGHLETQGAVLFPGRLSDDGYKPTQFKNWKEVISGHYHAQNKIANIHYIGIPYQLMWTDALVKQGFWIFDTTDRSWEFIENPHRYFHRLIWDDGCDYDMDLLTDAYVKINVKKKNSFEEFEKFIDKVNFKEPFEVKIVESFEEYNQENVRDLIELSSTTDLISEYIDDVATENNKESIKKLMIDIYEEAMSLDE
tara:strand:+ start:2215 stop:3249 length:1035 start_codon:yes stop_codon:yes gene_type:complete